MADSIVLQPKGSDGFVLPVPKSAIAQVQFADVDLCIVLTDGRRFVLPGLALQAMEGSPPKVAFADGSIGADKLFAMVGAIEDSSLNTRTSQSEQAKPEEADAKLALEKANKLLEEQQKALHEARERILDQKEAKHKIEEQAKKIAQQQEALEQAQSQAAEQEQESEETAANEINRQAVDDMAEKLAKISEELHSKDYDYVPPREFQPPPAPFAGPAGVPAPISMTPLVLLSMGNVVGTTTDTVSVPGHTVITGGGGPTGSDALAKMGPRDALQFAAATIEGTAGNDIIYANGTLMGNADPAADRSLYAKQFVLKVAGYFTTLDDIVFSGLPAGVSVTHATQRADGAWVLPSEYVTSEQTFEIVYDKNAWRSSGTDHFDMTVEVSGMMRNNEFHSTDTFRMQFMDVTDSSQSSDPALVCWLDSQTKQIYILPTLDQPNAIDHGQGDDVVHGGQSHDTITGGDGNNQIYAYEGNNVVTEGAGDNEITALGGDDEITVGDGANVIDAGGGTNVIHVGDGDNEITASGGDDQIVGGGGANTVQAGDGNNVITLGNGQNDVTAGSGADTITVGNGGNAVNAGDGNDFIYAGSGNDSLQGGLGDDVLRAGAGTNTVDGGAGSDVADYAAFGSGIVASLGTNTVTGAGLSDTLISIENLVGTAYVDTLTGSAAANTLYGGEGNDSIVGGGGTDTFYGDGGNDILTGGATVDTMYGGDGNDTMTGAGGLDILHGNAGDDIFLVTSLSDAGTAYSGGDGTDKVDYSATATALTIDLATGTGRNGAADLSTFSGVEWIVASTAGDTLTGGSANETLDGFSGNDTIDGGAGNDVIYGGLGDDTLTGGLGINTLSGGAGSNYYNMSLGQDAIVATGSRDELRYQYANSYGIVINLSDSAQTYAYSSATYSINANSGASWGNLNQSLSYSYGDTFSSNVVDFIYGSNYSDVIYGNSTSATYIYGYGGNDLIFCGSGNDFVYYYSGTSRLSMGAGLGDTFYTNGWAMSVYLDATADINGNGVADYVDKGLTLSAYTSSATVATTYTGFADCASGKWLLSGVEYLLGAGENNTFVGDANDNYLNARGGSNVIYGLGGSDTIYCLDGATNTIDGGSGTDTVSFYTSDGVLGGHSSNATNSSGTAVGVECYLADADLDGNGTMDKAGTWGAFSSHHVRLQSGGIYSYSTVANVENINGSGYDDKLAGNASVNVIHGNGGNDFISGNGGADSLYGDAGNDTFVVASGHIAGTTLISGGTGTDTLLASGWTFAAGSFSGAKYANLESIDVRNNAAGGVNSINANDIQAIVDSGNSSVLQIRLDSGDVITCPSGAGTGALSVLNTVHTGTDDQFKFYSDAGHVVNNSTNLVAVLNVHYGA